MRFQADPDRLLIQPLDCTDHRMENPNWSKGSALDNEVEVDMPSQMTVLGNAVGQGP